jgi:predicted Mrr-cat superfamily restriction endonuclease
MDWLGLALAILKLVNWITTQVSREQLKQDGRNELLAEQSLLILQRTERGKAIMEKVDAMSEDDIDAEFARLARLRAQRRDD